MKLRNFLIAAGTLVALLLVIQLIPYGRQHTNPPITAEPPWSSSETRALAERACSDCHSNETAWPWYSSVAPVSWLVVHDVQEGRQTLNFSEWDRNQQRLREIAEVLREGEMPPFYYVLQHPGARLSAAERAQLEQELTAFR
ncbi:MAG: heme-binding domain-containing protein [Anaerolineales bacterium]